MLFSFRGAVQPHHETKITFCEALKALLHETKITFCGALKALLHETKIEFCGALKSPAE
jgi:hypothetical protein